MSIALSQAGDASTLQLDGEIDIAVAEELKASLLEALASGHEISVSLAAATTLDVTSFQLLWAAEREARQSGLKFTVKGKLSETIQSALAFMGLDALLVE